MQNSAIPGIDNLDIVCLPKAAGIGWVIQCFLGKDAMQFQYVSRG